MRSGPRFGPGFLVAAAFIGPGTVTTASLAGARQGYALAWAVVAATIAALVLQEMAARLGAVGRMGLGEALRASFRQPLLRGAAVVLALGAITFGNAAYQAGNLTGAALGLESVAGGSGRVWVLACAGAATLLLATGAYRAVELVLISLVALMSVVFVATAVMIRPDLGQLAGALIRPSVPQGAGLLVLALVGTTVVPYNLFLHAAAVREKWRDREPMTALAEARRDSFTAVSLGGLITLAILLTAVPLFLAAVEVRGVGDMALQLEPLLGTKARWLFGAGLFAAGLTSAITAPLAAAWATSGLLGWTSDMRSWRFRMVWAAVMAVGTVFAVSGTRPLQAIVFAQAANGLLLPIVAGFLLWVMNRPEIMGAAVNRWRSNLAGGLVVLFAAALGGSAVWRAFLQ
jgi:manganese transport protein